MVRGGNSLVFMSIVLQPGGKNGKSGIAVLPAMDFGMTVMVEPSILRSAEYYRRGVFACYKVKAA